jgi:hypothetical protein
MISASDFVHLEYSPDLTPAGISFCRRLLPRLEGQRGMYFFSRLRRIIAGVAVELAVRRYLGYLKVPFGVASGTSFTNREQYGFTLGGHRCNIISFLISQVDEVVALQADPALALQAPALIPADQYASDGLRGSDVHIFAFLAGLVNDSPDEDLGAYAGGDPEFLVHVMPKAWASPRPWSPMAPLALKAESDSSVVLELAGQDGAGEFLTSTVELRPRQRLELHEGFYSLTHLHAKPRPMGAIGVSRTGARQPHLVRPGDWGDLWIRGQDILLLGWMRRDEFQVRAQVIPVGSRVFQFRRTRAKNFAVPVAELKPMQRLLGAAPEDMAID